MGERDLAQIASILQLCEDTDSILVVNKSGIVEYHKMPRQDYWKAGETVGRHILDLYPSLTEETSTILQALRTGQATYDICQEITNSRGERVGLTSDTIPIISNGRVECVVDSSRFYLLDQRAGTGKVRSSLAKLDNIVTRAPAMLALKRRIRDLSKTDSAVLIYGETGTGKELVAESLHSEGARTKGPFISQNCAAIPGNLLEGIFFGTEKGSYTGAINRKGLFEQADGGTLFLDEVNSMEPGLQVKLLKALEEKKIRHLGGSQDISFDARIIAAVNEDPLKLIEEGRLRQDLYYRLGVIRLNLPPLRERMEDVPLLTKYFIDRYNTALQRDIQGVSELALHLLAQYSWPGNVRELQNVIEGAFSATRSQLLRVNDIEEILESSGTRSAGSPPAEKAVPPIEEGFILSKEIERYEQSLIRQALAQTTSISQAARLLGTSRQNLKHKMQKYFL